MSKIILNLSNSYEIPPDVHQPIYKRLTFNEVTIEIDRCLYRSARAHFRNSRVRPKYTELQVTERFGPVLNVYRICLIGPFRIPRHETYAERYEHSIVWPIYISRGTFRRRVRISINICRRTMDGLRTSVPRI